MAIFQGSMRSTRLARKRFGGFGGLAGFWLMGPIRRFALFVDSLVVSSMVWGRPQRAIALCIDGYHRLGESPPLSRSFGASGESAVLSPGVAGDA